jgi:hypothetical protein
MYGEVRVSASISDTRCNPYNVVDPNQYGWWAPPVDLAHAEYELQWPRPYTVEKIKLKWKLKPPRVEVMVSHRPDQWTVMLFDDPQDDIELILVP